MAVRTTVAFFSYAPETWKLLGCVNEDEAAQEEASRRFGDFFHSQYGRVENSHSGNLFDASFVSRLKQQLPASQPCFHFKYSKDTPRKARGRASR